MLHELVDIAAQCPGVDAAAVGEALESGSARAAMMGDYREHASEVQGSPHFFFADGSDVHNPGIELHWVGDPGAGFPVVDSDDQDAFARLVRQAA